MCLLGVFSTCRVNVICCYDCLFWQKGYKKTKRHLFLAWLLSACKVWNDLLRKTMPSFLCFAVVSGIQEAASFSQCISTESVAWAVYQDMPSESIGWQDLDRMLKMRKTWVFAHKWTGWLSIPTSDHLHKSCLLWESLQRVANKICKRSFHFYFGKCEKPQNKKAVYW